MKGLFTQCAAILLREPLGFDRLAQALPEGRGKAPTGEGHWAFGDGAWVLPLGGGGRLMIDVVERPWPDAMGDPKQEPLVFGAWTMGHFGPGTFPGGLQRAAQQAWHWPEVRGGLPHAAFLRLRTTWVRDPEQPVLPEGYRPLPELVRLSRVGAKLLELPEALAWFDPVGEVLMNAEQLAGGLKHLEQSGQPPLDLWTNVRFFRAGESGWALMDTVGMGQLDLPDLEVVFDLATVQPDAGARLLRNVQLYLLDKGDAFEENHTVDGADGQPWACMRVRGLSTPPRPTRRFVQPGDRVPVALLDRGEA